MKARRLTASAFFLLPVALCLAPGCRNRSDLVEAELRTKEFQLRTLADEKLRLEAYNDALQREVKSLRDGTPWMPPEAAAQVYPLRSITLGRPTGGLDEDGKPGDEALQVLVEPRDIDGHTLKTPGTLFIAAQEILPEGLKRPLSQWEISGEALHRSWRSGLITTGYSVVLPWKTWPTTEKVRVVARFVLADGRAFEAEKDVTIRLAPGAPRRVAPPAEILPPPFIPPPPRPVEPASFSRSARRVPLSEAVELDRPIPLPQRVEWSR